MINKKSSRKAKRLRRVKFQGFDSKDGLREERGIFFSTSNNNLCSFVHSFVRFASI